MNDSLPLLTRSAIAELDLKSAQRATLDTLRHVDETAQKIAPIIGILRHQITIKDGKMADIEKMLPVDSVSLSTLRNAKVYQDVFKQFVLAGHVTETAFMALSFGDCRDLLAADKLASIACKNKKTKALDTLRESCRAGKSPKDILASVKKADSATVKAEKAREQERESSRKESQAKAAQERESFKAWKEAGTPAPSAPPAPPAIREASEALRAIMAILDSLPARERAKMPDMLRGAADFIASEASPSNIVTMEGEPLKKAA